jgi:anti-anti-sigma factor
VSKLRIRIVVDRGLFLVLEGSLTASNCRRLAEVTEKLFDGSSPPPPMVAFDVASLWSLDEPGLAVLVRAAELAQQVGTAMVVREPTRRVAKLLTVAGLGDLLRSDPVVAAAAAASTVGPGRRR